MPHALTRRHRSSWHVQTKDNFNYKPPHVFPSSRGSTITADDAVPHVRKESVLKRFKRALTIRSSPRKKTELSPSSPEVWLENTRMDPPDPPVDSPVTLMNGWPPGLYPSYYGPLYDSGVQTPPVWSPYYTPMQSGAPFVHTIPLPPSTVADTPISNGVLTLSPLPLSPPEVGRRVSFMPNEKSSPSEPALPAARLTRSNAIRGRPTVRPTTPTGPRPPPTRLSPAQEETEDAAYLDTLLHLRYTPSNEPSTEPTPVAATAAEVTTTDSNSTSELPPYSSMAAPVDVSTPPASPGVAPVAAPPLVAAHCTCITATATPKETWNLNLVTVLSFLSVTIVVFAVRDITFGALVVNLVPLRI